jgi:two-component sensor histidine kinase
MGSVRLSWLAPEDGPSDRFRMRWEENGGPPFEATARRGFGHKVIVDMATYQLAADVTLTPRPDGLTWHLDAPRERVVLERKETRS